MFEIKESSVDPIVLGTDSEVIVASGIDVVLVDFGNECVDRVLNVGKNARVKFLKMYAADAAVEYDNSITVHCDEGAKVDTVAAYFGGAVGNVTIQGHVNESVATSDIRVLYFAENDQKFNLTVRNDFHKKDSGGEIEIRGVTMDSAYSYVRGEIGIDQVAGGTDSELNAHALMFGKKAHVRQMPILEINTNEVSASHGATISRIQEEDLFYFNSRGVDKEMAYSLCVNGFLAALLESTQHFGEYHERILDLIEKKTHERVLNAG